MFKEGHKEKIKVLFILILFLKILTMSFFSSGFQDDLFYPFVKFFAESFNDPWKYYFEQSLNIEAFPYHALMLYLLTPATLIINFFKIENNIVYNFLFKLPLLISDLIIFLTLVKLFPAKKRKIIIYYFGSPIVIYAIYIHSQLDLIPMALFMLGVYFLTIEKLNISALFIGLSLATKFHVLVALPLLLLYLFKKHNAKSVIKYLFVTIGVFIFFDIPYIFDAGFHKMVLFNPKQSLLFDSYLNIGELKLLLPIAAILIVYFHFFNQRRVNQDLLFFYFGILFTATIFFIYPAPGWYVWLVPFISIYFINSEIGLKTMYFYLVFSITYIVFFVFYYNPEYIDILILGKEINFKTGNQNQTNISFTFLLSMLLTIMYVFYKYGVKSNSVYKKQTNLTIGIGGDSGVGKSTLLGHISLILGNRLLTIEGDGEHKWERDNENWSKFTHLNPKANFIHKQAEVIRQLKLNNSIFRSDYDHVTGKFTTPLKIVPKEFIAISGLHPFYLPNQRKNIDLKVFINTDNNIRKHWKILRDVNKRGYSTEKILGQIESRHLDGEKFIHPQRNFADLIIEFFSIDKFKVGDPNCNINLGLRFIVDASLHLEDILVKLETDYNWDYNEDLKTQFVVIEQEPQVDFRLLAYGNISNIHDIISPNNKWLQGYHGLLQLVLLMMISEKLKMV
jgi:uridine kinase